MTERTALYVARELLAHMYELGDLVTCKKLLLLVKIAQIHHVKKYKQKLFNDSDSSYKEIEKTYGIYGRNLVVDETLYICGIDKFIIEVLEEYGSLSAAVLRKTLKQFPKIIEKASIKHLF